MKWLSFVWAEKKVVVIQNCWLTTGILPVLDPLQKDSMEATFSAIEVEYVVDEMVAMVVRPSWQIFISMLLDYEKD